MPREKNSRTSRADSHRSLLTGEEAYATLTAIVQALDELAPWRPLSSDAEWVRHNCRALVTEMEGNPGGFIRGEAGPEGKYSWIAKWTRDPTPQGLDGGRLQYFELFRYEAPIAANDYKYPPPSNTLLARYINGKLARFGDDALTEALIGQIKQPVPDAELRLKASRSRNDPVRRKDGVHHNLVRAAKALDDLAADRPLSPGAEEARNLCHGALRAIEGYDPWFEEAARRAARLETARSQDRDRSR